MSRQQEALDALRAVLDKYDLGVTAAEYGDNVRIEMNGERILEISGELDAEEIEVKVCWGHFGPSGMWVANPHLGLTVEGQHRRNVANRYMTSGGMRL